MKREKNSNFFQIAFNDILFNLLLGFIYLFLITLLYVDPKGSKNDEDIPSKAEYMIVMSWDTGINVDMDLWVKTDKGVMVGFKFTDHEFLHLERDDLGNDNDMVSSENLFINSELYRTALNQETIVFRAKPKGTYTVNAHYYRGDYTTDTVPRYFFPRVTVEIQLVQVNPTYRVIFIQKREMWKDDQEFTFFNFDIDENGEVVLATITDIPNLFVNRLLESTRQ